MLIFYRQLDSQLGLWPIDYGSSGFIGSSIFMMVKCFMGLSIYIGSSILTRSSFFVGSSVFLRSSVFIGSMNVKCFFMWVKYLNTMCKVVL